MNLKRKIEVVMLSTNEKAIIGLNSIHNHLFIANDMAEIPTQSYQNLYFLSGEAIRERDLCILDLGENTRVVRVKSLNSGHPVFTVDIEDGYAQLSSLKKIIATTDKSITQVVDILDSVANKAEINLPEPSPQFIKKYIEEYDKGNKIQWVMIDYIKTTRCVKCKSLMEHWKCTCSEEYNYTIQEKIKVDKNNQITISKVKDSWSREELRPKFLKLCHDVADYIEKGYDEKTEFNIDKWIEENL